MYRYNDQVTFDLPKGYIHRTVDDPNGNTREEICYGEGKDANGNEVWEFRANILLGASDNLEGYTREKNEKILDFYKRGLENSRFSKEPTAPGTAVYAVRRPIRVFGMLLKYKIAGIIAVIDQDHLLILQVAYQQDEDNPDPEIKAFSHLMKVGNSIRINGKPVDFSRPDPKKLVRELKFSYDEENDESSLNLGLGLKVKNADGEETDAGTISISGKPEEGKKKVTGKKTDNKKKRAFVPIEQEGNRLIFGGCWSMELVSNCRLDREPLDDESTGKQYVIKNGTREIWKFIIADDKNSQTIKSAVSEVTQGVMKKLHDAQNIIDLELRNDSSLKIELHASMAGSGFSCAMVKVETPDGIIYALTSILPDIDDMEEAMQKLNSEEIGLFHPFGVVWEAQWTLIMRMVASIRSLDDPDPDDDNWVIGGYEYALNPEQEIIPGVQCRIPKTAIKIGEKTYALTEFGLDPKQQVTGQNILTFSFIHSNREEPFDKQSSEPHNRLMITHLGKGFASILREKRTEGFHACLGYIPLGDGKFIISLMKDQLIAQIFIECGKQGNHPLQFEAMQCAEKLFDSLVCGSMLEEAPSVFPPTPEFLHEHYDLVESGSYTTHRDADFTGQSIRMLLEKHDNKDEEAYKLMTINREYHLDQDAISLAKVFRLDSTLFDPYGDTEALIRKGMFKDARSFEALRSLAWTVSCMADRSGREPGDYSFEELEKIGELIAEQNYLNYTAFSYMPGLCDHYDWHVFYVPDEYLRSDYQSSNDLRYLTGKENRGGNSITIVGFGGFGGFGNMNRISNLISRNEETLESLEALQIDLEALLPVMETIHDGLLKGRNRKEKLEGVLADALTAWCALAIAAKEPFYSEEAADTYEADAGLDSPLKKPTDKLDDKPIKYSGSAKTSSNVKKATAKPAVKKTSVKPSGDVLDLGGATVIKDGQFAGNMTLKNIIIPEGVTEIGEMAFNSCMFLESVVFPKSLRKVKQFAFMSCRALKKVELQEGVEELETHAFGATNNLKEVHLPDSLKKVDRTVFGMGGDSPYATVYLSGNLANRLMEEYNKEKSWPSDAIYARHYVIDGVGYENMTDFWKMAKNGSVKIATAAKTKTELKPEKKGSEKTTEQKISRDELASKIRPVPNFSNTQWEKYTDERKKWIRETYDILKKIYMDNPAPSYAAMKREYPKVNWEAFEYLAGREITNKKTIAQFLKEEGLIQDPKKAATATDKKPTAKASVKAEDAEKAKTKLPVKNPVKSESHPVAKTVSKNTVKLTTKPIAKTISQSASKETINENANRYILLDTKGARVLKEKQFWYRKERNIEIPEGVVEIENSAMNFSDMETIKLPKSLKKIGQQSFGFCKNLKSVIIQEGLLEIDNIAFTACPELNEIWLPDSLEKIGNNPFADDILKHLAHIIVHLSGNTAKRLYDNRQYPAADTLEAGGFIIDGKKYKKIEDFIPVWEAEQKRKREAERRKQEEFRKQQERSRLMEQISALEKERDAIKRLFGGMKRKKIQRQIDELKERLSRI